MTSKADNDLFQGCETREDYLQRFEQILQREIQISGYVAEYLKARCDGQSIEEAASLLPGPDSPLARELEELCVVVDLLMRTGERVEADIPPHG